MSRTITTSTPSTPPRVRHGAVTAVVCLALTAVVAAMSSLNLAIPDIARSTHASQTQLAWIIDAYSLVFAAMLLPAGALGDRFGRRRALIVGLAIFGLGSLAAMTVSDAHQLIALRTVIGLGAALVMPATLSTITGTFPPEKRTKAVSVWAAVAGGAAVLGVLCSGVLLEFFSWRSVFGLNVVLAVVAVVGALVVVPESADPNTPKLDKGGSALAILGLVVVVYWIIEAPTRGWTSLSTVVGIAAGLAILAGFVAYELRQEHPMLDPRVFAHRGLSVGSLVILVQFFAFFGFIFLILQFLQIVRQDSALLAAVSMLPMAVTMMPSARVAPKAVARFGARAVCVTGLLLVAGALILIAQVDATSPYAVLAAGLLVLGAGMGLAMTPSTSAITSALPPERQGVASGINDLSRELGSALGIAIIGSIMAAVYRSQLVLPGVPAPVVAQAKDSFAVAAHAGGAIAAHANTAFVDGVQVALYSAAGVVALAALVVLVVLPRRSAEESAAKESAAVDTPAPESDRIRSDAPVA